MYQINETVPESFGRLAPVVAKFNMSEYFEDIAKQEELKRMKDVLVRERKRLEEQVTWDLIAEKSPEFASMLKAFRDAGGQFNNKRCQRVADLSKWRSLHGITNGASESSRTSNQITTSLF